MNQVVIKGRVGRDPELRFTTTGKAIANFSVATGGGKYPTMWHYCQAWEKTAELIGENVKKGDMVFIIGSIKYSEYQNKQGQKVNKTEIVVKSIDKMAKLVKANVPKIEEAEGFEDLQEDEVPF